MSTPIYRLMLLGVAITGGWAPGIARAQPPEPPPEAKSSFSSLKGRLPIGDVVYITDATGATLKGKLAALMDDEVQVIARRELCRVAFAEVRRIEWQQPDPVLNGLLMGAAIGAIPGIYYLAVDPNECTGLCPGEYGLIAAGAVVGVVVDRAIRKKVTVYAVGDGGRSGRSVTIAPLAAPGRAGVRIAVRF